MGLLSASLLARGVLPRAEKGRPGPEQPREQGPHPCRACGQAELRTCLSPGPALREPDSPRDRTGATAVLSDLLASSSLGGSQMISLHERFSRTVRTRLNF